MNLLSRRLDKQIRWCAGFLFSRSWRRRWVGRSRIVAVQAVDGRSEGKAPNKIRFYVRLAVGELLGFDLRLRSRR